ncbi:glutamate receptor ionotropic, kainate 2-like [Palaemon carinicauda]|uniref:glutamate receptor ionotropic, kainate 2-like n=1 Tax=Palaemon carinicauda TaxID=392227 RepID=UPI0035B597EA
MRTCAEKVKEKCNSNQISTIIDLKHRQENEADKVFKFISILDTRSTSNGNGEPDVLSESLAVTSSVLRESWMPSCTITLFIDGATSSTTVKKIIQDIGMEAEYAVYEVPREDVRSTSGDGDLFQSINQIRTSSRCMTLLLATSDEEFLKVSLEKLLKNNVVTWPTRLLVVTRLSSRQLRQSKNLLSRLNAMVIILEDYTKGRRFGVYAYIPYSHRMALVASWTEKSRLKFVEDQQLFPDKFRRFPDGGNLVAAAIRYPPHVYFQEEIDDLSPVKKYRITGTMKFLVDMIAGKVNFTYDVITPPIGSWGYGYPNGSWDGLVGMALREEVDLSIGPAVVLFNRALVIDYCDTLMVKYIRILGRRGSTEANPWSFVMPLAPSVWAATFATLLAIFVIVTILSKIMWDSMSLSPKMSISMYIRALLMQDIRERTDNIWEKLLFGAWLLTVLVLIEAYSATLFSLLALRRVPEPYHSLRAVLHDPKAIMIWFGNTAYTQFFEAAESGIFKEVYEAGQKGRITYISPQEYVGTVDRLVSRGDHVLLHPGLAMKMFLTEDFMDKGSCKFYFSREMLIPMAFSLMLPKYSPLRGPINEGIRAAVEGGLYSHWLESTMTNPKSCRNPPSKIYVNSALSLMNTWGMFVALATGYIVSLFLFCLEILQGKLTATTQ